MTKREEVILQRLGELVHNGEIGKDGLVSLLKLCETYLNLQRISDYAKDNNISTQHARKHKDVIKICNYQLIISE